MASAGGRLQAYEKTSAECVARSYPSVVRFAGHVQLKGGRPRTVEAYGMMVRLLARWAGHATNRIPARRPGADGAAVVELAVAPGSIGRRLPEP